MLEIAIIQNDIYNKMDYTVKIAHGRILSVLISKKRQFLW